MTEEQRTELMLSRIKDRELLDSLRSLHRAMRRREHLRMANDAQRHRFIGMSQPDMEEEWVRR